MKVENGNSVIQRNSMCIEQVTVVMKEMPRYRLSETVGALRIKNMFNTCLALSGNYDSENNFEAYIEPDDDGFTTFKVSNDYYEAFRRSGGYDNCYYFKHEDGTEGFYDSNVSNVSKLEKIAISIIY